MVICSRAVEAGERVANGTAPVSPLVCLWVRFGDDAGLDGGVNDRVEVVRVEAAGSDEIQ